MKVIASLISALGRVIEIVVSTALGVSAILGLGIFGPIQYLALSALAIFAAVLIHETGHLFAGLALGWKFQRIALGPFEVEHSEAGSRFRCRIRNARRLTTLGYVSIAPTSFERFRLESAVVVGGGPLASAMGVLGFVILMVALGEVSIRSPWAVMIQWSTLGLVSLAPSRGRLDATDGFTLWQLSRGGADAEECQRAALCTMSHTGPLRPRDWPAELMLPIAGPGEPVRSYECYIAYVHHLDRDEIECASLWLKRLVDQRGPGDPPEYLLEAAYFWAAHLDDAGGARKWIVEQRGDAEPWVRERAEAAIFLASGEFEDARHCAERAAARLRSAMPCGAHEYELERLRRLAERSVECNALAANPI